MMKITKLLLIGILSVISNPQVANNQTVAKNSTFHQISRTIAANARITVGLNALSLFVQPSLDQEYVFREAMSLFFNFNRSIIDGFAIINEKHAESVLKTIGNMKTSGINVDEPLKNIQAMEKIIEEVNELPPLPDHSETNVLISEIDKLKELHVLDLTTFGKYLEDMNISDNRLNRSMYYVNSDFSDALSNTPEEVYHLINELIPGEKVSEFTRVFEPFEKRIELFGRLTKEMIDSVLELNTNQVHGIFNHSTPILAEINSIRAINVISMETKGIVFSNQFSDLNELTEDFNNKEFLDVLNEEANSTVLQMIISPVYKVSDRLKPYWKEIQRVLKRTEMETSIKQLNALLTYLYDAISQDTSFRSSMNSISELKGLIKDPVEKVKKYVEMYLNIRDAMKKYESAMYDVKTMKDQYKKLDKLPNLRDNILHPSAYTYVYPVDKFDELNTTIEELTRINTTFTSINQQLESINILLKDVDWKSATKEIDDWIKTDLKSLFETMKAKSEIVNRIKSGFNFIRQLQSASFPNLESNIGELEKSMKKMKEEVGKMNEELKVKMDPSDKQEPFYKYMIHLRYEYYHLKDQLASGAYLFKLFDRFLENINAFDKFLDKGEDLLKKLKKKSYEKAKKMEKVVKVMGKVEEMKKEIRLRRKRYDGRPMKPLFKLRWLIENLQNVPNPELRIQELKEIADDIGSDASEFKTSLDGIFDLDFGFHQQIINGTFANYRGLVRYNHLILKITAIQDRTFFEWYYPYIEIAKFMGISILANVLLYAGAIYKIRYDERQEKIREKELRDEYFEWRMREINEKKGIETDDE